MSEIKHDIGPTTKHEIKQVNKIIMQEKPKRMLNFTVEKTGEVAKTKETFLTQKGGKM
jgi:hypothetical protein